jgi:two-component system response regulator HydG
MEQAKTINVAIVGGGPGCKAIMEMIFSERLSQLRMKLVGVASTNPKAMGYCHAEEKGIYTTRDYRDLYKLKDLDMIIELTGHEEVAKEIARTKPEHVRLTDHIAARLFWDVFQIEEESISSCKRAEEAMHVSFDQMQVAYDQSIIYAEQVKEQLTQRKRAEEALRKSEKELRRRHHALEAINSILYRVTKEYNLNGMGEVLHDVMEEFYSGANTLIFLLAPRREDFYFPRPERGRVKETSYDRANKRIKDRELGHDLLRLLTRERIRPASSGSKADYPAVLQDLASGFASWMTVPIEVEDVCYGLFMVGSPAEDTWLAGDLVFVESLVRQISGVIRYQISKEAREDAFRDQLAGPDRFMGILGRSQAMHEVYRLVEAVADSESTVLITGESGTGKELVARAIHGAGRYKDTPFIPAHCSSFTPSLVQSELFGHEKGAFTGATSRKLGRLERAHGGILFLDEVAELPLETQVLLLRFLQDKSFERVGGEHPVKVNVRILAATNRRVEEEVKARRLRKDFYYRLNVIPLHVPSLKDRISDVPLLADHFLRTSCLIEGKEITGFDTKAMQMMMDHDWPGNVRELENTIARCVVLSAGSLIGVGDLPQKMQASPVASTGYSLPKNERNLIRTALRECHGNKKEAARLLEISRGTLYSKLKRYGIET